MKTAALSLLLVCLVLAPLSAQRGVAAPLETQRDASAPLGTQKGAGNTQKIFPIDSEVYEAITALSIAGGLCLPSTAGPWSADELYAMLGRVDRAGLSGEVAALYDFALARLRAQGASGVRTKAGAAKAQAPGPGVATQPAAANPDATPTRDAESGDGVTFGVVAAVEASYHTDTLHFRADRDWIRGYDERRPMFDLNLETWLARHFYGYSSFTIANNRYDGFGPDGASSTLAGAHSLTPNLVFVPPADHDDLDFNFPRRAFASIGGEGWNFQIGRDRISWGPGRSGNFVIGDQLPYHSMGRFTAYSRNFKYSLLGSFFPHPQNYYPIMDDNGRFLQHGNQTDPDRGLSLFLGHRLEWRLFSDRLGFSITEAIMYQSADNTFDLRVLNPAMIFHNYFIRGNANSILTVELDWAAVKGLNVYGQVVIDEFALGGELVPGVDEGAFPDAWGCMAGLRGVHPLAGGVLEGSLEWALTSPYLYLRDKGNYEQNPGEYGINWVVAFRDFANNVGVVYTEDFLGYRYGGDAIVVDARLGYRKYGSWRIGASFLAVTHGTHDKWTLWTKLGAPGSEHPWVGTPTSTHSTGNNGDPDAGSRDTPSFTTAFGLRGGLQLLPYLELFAEGYFISVRNPGNRSSNPTIHDLQISVGTALTL
jgi:hypothetical protein